MPKPSYCIAPGARAALCYAAIMQLCDVYRKLGEEQFTQLVRGISMGKLKTYQLFDALKTRAHMAKLNTEHLRKAAPRLWARIDQGDEEFAKDFAQAVLVSHLDLIGAVLDFLSIPNQNGFFEKDLDASQYLTEGWAQRTFEKFRGSYPEAVLVFYLNHLAWELKGEPFAPAA
ncbi:MAG TPA: hypothetical protein VK335_12370 [Bryobacteraceae bacterium]|nr:hypothetical protein [Bryobacteraceae bacterium]